MNNGIWIQKIKWIYFYDIRKMAMLYLQHHKMNKCLIIDWQSIIFLEKYEWMATCESKL